MFSLYNFINDLIGNSILGNYIEFYLLIIPILLMFGMIFSWNFAYSLLDLVRGRKKQ